MKVQDLGGATWTVRRQWLPRYEGRGIRARFAARRQRRKDRPAGKSHWWDNVDFIPSADALDDVFWIVLAIVAVVLFILFGIPLLLAVFDVVFVLVVGLVGVVGRVLFRRPWTIEAVSTSGEHETSRVVGWRASGKEMQRLASRLRTRRTATPRV